MVRSILFAIAACMTLCAATVVTGIERAIDWMLGVLPISPPRLALSGDLNPAAPVSRYADPHVSRHEARMSTRAAARGI